MERFVNQNENLEARSYISYIDCHLAIFRGLWVPTTPAKITREGLFLDDLQTINHELCTICLENMNKKSFIANKTNIIAFIRTGESGEISSQQKPAEKAPNVQIV